MSSTIEDGVPRPTPISDEDRLAQLGYQQELRRKLSGFSNFAVSFSIISILAGAITSYGIAMTAGGPLAITLGWLFVGVMVVFVALAMAEICSIYPTAGALYWWAAALAKRNKAAWAWFVGWFNFLGEVAVTAAIDFGAAITTAAFLSLAFDMEVTAGRTFLIFLLIIVAHGLLNTFGVNLVRVLSDISAWWHLVGVAVIVVVLAIVPDQHKPISEVFLEVRNETGFTFAGAAGYAVLIGLLMAQYTYTGYDASAHVAEETHDAARSAPRGIVMSVVVSVIAGFVLLFAITWSIQDYQAERTTELGLPPAQIFIDAAGRDLGTFLLFICVVAQFFCGMASVTANSRMAYAFSRDGALPGSRIWKRVNPRTGTPTNSIWLCVACSALLVLPSLWNTTAYLAATSIAVIGLYIAYVAPVFLRRRAADLAVGPWNLGRWSAPVGWTAIVWVAIICVLFVLPTSSPVTASTFNYTIVAVGVVLGGAWLWWVFSARRWFTGPRHNVPDPVIPRPAAGAEPVSEATAE
ncbi:MULTISPECIES: amino acid permease [Micromonospora]|uniref:Amino acid permease n=1 Tax=Micromonospora solifontis TaxID=2487138 RepID=A0ABX9WLQ9_9ACTN|nr:MULTISPECIES: amino acid permease [Micromonospora]NES16089.1 amino acid permease [Micromonospora sp. PPF5-17B]NES34923.1 amino acid permease [Micromonospora solifontis]NES57641.1 amino acid permease [Micromonospora sp. PPF5-6]RNM01488.1 amino acid permease [Micromonospora solifontis]